MTLLFNHCAKEAGENQNKTNLGNMKRGLEAVAMEQVGPENNLRPNGRDDDGADTSGDKPRSRGIRLAAETDLSGFFEWSWMTLEGPNNENVMSTR